MGAQMVKEVASKTSDVAGDGTTTATVLAQSDHPRRHEVRRRRHEPDGPEARHRQGCHRRGRRAEEGQQATARLSKEIAQVGSISANADESIGKIIAEAMDKVGKEGVITVEDGKSLDNELDSRRGHAVRPRLPVALLHQQPRQAGRDSRQPVRPAARQEDQQHP